MSGEIVKENGILRITRIHVIYHLSAPESVREKIERVHTLHKDSCPVYRSICEAIDITTEYRINS